MEQLLLAFDLAQIEKISDNREVGLLYEAYVFNTCIERENEMNEI